MDSLVGKLTDFFLSQGISGAFNIIALYVIYRLASLVQQLMEKRIEEAKTIMTTIQAFTTALQNLTEYLKGRDK